MVVVIFPNLVSDGPPGADRRNELSAPRTDEAEAYHPSAPSSRDAGWRAKLPRLLGDWQDRSCRKRGQSRKDCEISAVVAGAGRPMRAPVAGSPHLPSLRHQNSCRKRCWGETSSVSAGLPLHLDTGHRVGIPIGRCRLRQLGCAET